MRLLLCLALYATIKISEGVSTKMDFGEDSSITVSNTSNSRLEDGDVEVKHTIVVSTKLNNNRRGGVTHGDGDGTLSYNIGKSSQDKEESGEVPVVKSYRSVETTKIRTPDTRHKAQIYPDSIFVNRNIRDEADVYPNVIANPLNWKPANFYNNINYRHSEGRDPYSMARRQNPNVRIQNRISDEAMKDFYCKKCVEFSRGQGLRGCGVQQRSVNNANSWVYETTTQKVKIDGKLAKLN